jgi:hypothetical protein
LNGPAQASGIGEPLQYGIPFQQRGTRAFVSFLRPAQQLFEFNLGKIAFRKVRTHFVQHGALQAFATPEKRFNQPIDAQPMPAGERCQEICGVSARQD